MKHRMKAITVLSLTLAGATAGFAQQQTLTGTLTDSMCGLTHMLRLARASL